MYTNSELIETILNDLNDYMKAQAHGQYVQGCIIVSNIAQKLVNLRKTIDNDLKNREDTISQLKDQLRKLGHEIIEVSPEEFTQGEQDEQHH
jgi:uncharacterized phage protein gp47/JayE